MSTEDDKFKNSKRRMKDQDAVKRQLKIVKGAFHTDQKDVPDIQQPHRLHKKHALDCGKPNCMICGNPRKIFKEPTQQEKRMFQDIDKPNNKKGNGNKNEEE